MIADVNPVAKYTVFLKALKDWSRTKKLMEVTHFTKKYNMSIATLWAAEKLDIIRVHQTFKHYNVTIEWLLRRELSREDIMEVIEETERLIEKRGSLESKVKSKFCSNDGKHMRKEGGRMKVYVNGVSVSAPVNKDNIIVIQVRSKEFKFKLD